MAHFPWDSLKAETLRSICKDLGTSLGPKRKREDMITLIKEFETRGLSSASKDSEATGEVVPAKLPVVSNDMAPKPVTKLHGNEECQDSDKESEEMDTGDCPKSDDEPTCPCEEGWLSPRMKFILSTVAAVASDLVRDTGEFAGEFGHVGVVYMAKHIPPEEHPRGKKAAAQWVKGLSTLYSVIYKMFKAGRIPTEPALMETLEKLSKSDKTLVVGFTKYTEIEHALSGLVQQAKEEWADEFQETHCDGDKKWRKLPVCAEHDLDWTMVEDMLVG